jgi:serine/threonine-protein kinase
MASEPTADEAGRLPREETPVAPADPPTAPWPRPEAGPPSGEAARPGAPTVPGYELLKVLGRGGMGVVYLARQAGFDRLVALKMLLAGAHADAEQMDRFRREAEAVGRLRRPGIVEVFAFGESGGCPYFSLEYLEGGSLADRLRAGPLPPREAAELVAALAEAVQYAHEQGVVHRDLKPANVLFTADGAPKIADFGLAKTLDGDTLTRTGAVLGTPGYMAPEQAGGRSQEIGPATDVHALGAILYECLTGRPPFQATTPMLTLVQVMNDVPMKPSQLQPGTPRDLEAICMKCLEKQPGRRYPSARALAEDLRRFLSGERTHARLSWRPRPLRWAGALAAVVLICVVLHFLNQWLHLDRVIPRPNRLLAENVLPALFLTSLAVTTTLGYLGWRMYALALRLFGRRGRHDPLRLPPLGCFLATGFIFALLLTTVGFILLR